MKLLYSLTLAAAFATCASSAQTQESYCVRGTRYIRILDNGVNKLVATQNNIDCLPQCSTVNTVATAKICVKQPGLMAYPILDEAGQVTFIGSMNYTEREVGNQAFIKAQAAYLATLRERPEAGDDTANGSEARYQEFLKTPEGQKADEETRAYIKDMRDCRALYGGAYQVSDEFDPHVKIFARLFPCHDALAPARIYVPKMSVDGKGVPKPRMVKVKDLAAAAGALAQFRTDVASFIARQGARNRPAPKITPSWPLPGNAPPAAPSRTATPIGRPAKLTIAQYDEQGLKCPPAPYVRLGSHNECTSGDDCVCSTDPGQKIGQ